MVSTTVGRRRRLWSGSGSDIRDPQPRRHAADMGDALKGQEVMSDNPASSPAGSRSSGQRTPTTARLLLSTTANSWSRPHRRHGNTDQRPRTVVLASYQRGDGSSDRRPHSGRGPEPPTWRFGHRHVSGRGPRDTYG